MQAEPRVIKVASTLTYNVASPTTFVFNVASAVTPRQVLRHENLSTSPAVDTEWFELGEAGYRSLRLKADPGTLQLDYEAEVELRLTTEEPPALGENQYQALPAEVLGYLNPSRYCESDRLGQFSYKEFGQTESGYTRVERICEWVHSNIDYVSGTTNASSTACDVLLQRTGVCRDFAHVGIALCRALGIPARYVSGYAPELQPPDFHGFFEAYLGDRWYLFDATQLAPKDSFVRIGVGRDAADVAVANIVGQASLTAQSVSAAVTGEGQQQGGPRGGDQADEVAVSTA